jgi:hypothetical protein
MATGCCSTCRAIVPPVTTSTTRLEFAPGAAPAGARASASVRPHALTYRRALLLALTLAALTWAPRLTGPIDLRWDGGVYYELGTSLAQGKGYRLLNEPGEIAANQYPPLLPLIIAAHERVLGTSDVVRVGHALRLTAAALFGAYAFAVFQFLASWLSPGRALAGTALSILTLHVYFLSDLAFPEIPFSICVLVFLLAARRGDSGTWTIASYLAAAGAYALRTVGLAALAAWVAESVFKRRFRQALLRAAIAALPVLSWQAYVASVESSAAYQHPAYVYQRAPYMFYNVSYAKNVSLLDPFTPERGKATPAAVVSRVVHNAMVLPVNIGETVVVARGYVAEALFRLIGNDRTRAICERAIELLLIALGLFAAAGLVTLILDDEWRTPLFTAAYLCALCLAPFQAQLLRYLMPLAPLFFLALLRWRRIRVAAAAMAITLACTLLAKGAVAAEVFSLEHQGVTYQDAAGAANYRMFFYNPAQQDFDRVVDYLAAHASPSDVVSSGTPQWIFLRTGLKAVMPPFEADVEKEQRLLESVPVAFLVEGGDVIGSERYTSLALARFPERWERVFSSPAGYWSIYKRR